MKEYLRLPVRVTSIFESKPLVTTNILDSIYRNLHLIITTSADENKADNDYGVYFWDDDYDIHLTNDARKEMIISGLQKQIQRYEKRITDIAINVNVKQAVFKTATSEGMRRKVEIIITGVIRRSTEPFNFQTGFFIGPYSLS